MPDVMNLYLDDSGSRHPDKKTPNAPRNRDWFALGGVLVRDDDELSIREKHGKFMERWDLDPDTTFLHSHEIRFATGNFTFLGGLGPAERDAFFADLFDLINSSGLLGFACVIDRPGYNARYRGKYGVEGWSLCKTAFPIVVERAAKYAREKGCKVRVFVERTDKVTDSWMEGYYRHLKQKGLPFDGGTSGKYGPLTQAELGNLLHDFKKKNKSSPLMQLADLYLYPMCLGGYVRSYRPYQELMKAGRLIDCHLKVEEIPSRGIKYSCWELVKVET
jgi:hypothetical protein